MLLEFAPKEVQKSKEVGSSIGSSRYGCFHRNFKNIYLFFLLCFASKVLKMESLLRIKHIIWSLKLNVTTGL